jgi:hypothetical protein
MTTKMCPAEDSPEHSSGNCVHCLRDQLEAAEKFKAFVHAYLDQHGVPADDPDNEHSKQGCRIGARLDLLFEQRDGADRRREREVDGLLQRLEKALDQRDKAEGRA